MEWVIFFGVCSICYVIYKLVLNYFEYRGKFLKDTWRYVMGWLIFISIFGSFYVYEEKSEMKDNGIYYVQLYEGKDSQKNYKVPAKISVDPEDGYGLIEVYWSNGGELTFYNSESDLKIGERIPIKDDNNKKWFVELSRQKATISP